VVTVPTMLERRAEQYETRSKELWNRVTIKMQYDFMADDGSKISVVIENEGCDSGDKATNKALSMAHKYAFIQLFHIPTEDIEDGDSQIAAAAAAIDQAAADAEKKKATVSQARPGLSPADAAAKMKAAAPPKFHKVEPAVAPATTVEKNKISICDCGAPGNEHASSGCLIQGCGCGAFQEFTKISVDEYERLQINGHIPKKALFKIKPPLTITEWITYLHAQETKEELTAAFNVDVPKNMRPGKLTEVYGRLFNAYKAKETPAGKN
ncbi:MAG TPA: ERF family protein, partial [Candidatus Sulfotelmatobacter sp.]|nr:ERF family protein [Candidatus Sulfotelmatobacter sp.]